MELLGGFEYEFGSFLILLKFQYIIMVKIKDIKNVLYFDIKVQIRKENYYYYLVIIKQLVDDKNI